MTVVSFGLTMLTFFDEIGIGYGSHDILNTILVRLCLIDDCLNVGLIIDG